MGACFLGASLGPEDPVPFRTFCTDHRLPEPIVKIARKLTWATIAFVCLILGVAGVLTIRREARMLEMDMLRDHQSIGRLAAFALAEAPSFSGGSDALARIEREFEQSGSMRLRRVEAIAPHGAGEFDGRFYSYVPMPDQSRVKGFIEVSESTAEVKMFTRESMARTVVLTLFLAVCAIVFATLLGSRLIGKPIARLADKARRVGGGELTEPLDLPQHDELGDLAREMNQMCERLSAANARVEAEAKARLHAMEALRHADRLATVGTLASGIAHELGTPLNVIAARARMIENNEGTLEELCGYGRIVAEQTGRITRIIRQLLDFARGRKPGSVASSTSKVRIDLRPLASNMCNMLSPLAGKRGVMLKASEGEPAMTIGEQGPIEQVLANLVVNAIQASGSGTTVSIDVGQTRVIPPEDVGGEEGDFIRLDVQDQGSGITPEHIEHIFEPFFTTKKVGEGTGLGLSVAYGIAREHGGWIAVKSQPGQGSCFSLFLPKATV
jgi:signal transduction histidine kinase